MTDLADPWSATRFDVHRRLRELRETGGGAVATVVDVEGSAYRRPGAKLVVGGDESMGAITAGCIEGPLLDLATDVEASGTPVVETFDLTDDDEWGIGLGCNGVIDILLEPLDDSFDVALDELDAKRPVTVLSVVETDAPDVPLGARSTIVAGGERYAPDDHASIPRSVLDQLDPALQQVRNSSRSFVETVTVDGHEVSVFVDGMEPVHDIVLFGTQNDIHPVSRLARQVGFRVVVASGRGAKSSSETFPEAHTVESVRAPDLASIVDADDYTLAVLMSHNFIDDRLALESLLTETDVPYIGLMGPRKRFERMREELAADGTELTSEHLERIATPVGLDLGGGEPAEIALSIVSEAQAVANDRPGGRLRDAAGPIHPRAEPPR